MSNSRIKNSIYNITTGLLGQLIISVLGFGVRTVFISSLGKTYLGVSGLFSNILTILSFAELGIGQAIIYSLYTPIAQKDKEKICSLMHLYKSVYTILFFVVLGIGLAILPVLPYIINDFDSIPNLRIIYVLYVISSASSYLFVYKSTFLTANQQNYRVTIVSYVVNLVVAVLQIVTLVLFQQYLVYLIIQITSGIIQNIYVAHLADKLFPFLKNKKIKPLDREELNKIKKNVGALVVYKIGTLSLNSTDNIIISKYVGLLTVGIYSNYLLITSTVSGFLSTIFGNLTASIGNLNASALKDRQYFMFRVINLATFWLYSYVAICLYILSNPFIGICWIGPDYLLTNAEVFIIALNVYIGGMLFAPYNYRQTMGLFVQGKIRPIISAVENIVVSIVLAKSFGLSGVLWGTAITRLTTNGWYDPYIVYRKMDLNPLKYMADYLAKMALMLLIGGGCVAISSLLTINGIVSWLFCAIIISLFVNIAYLVLFWKTEEFQYLWNVVNMILKKMNIVFKAYGKKE